MTTEKLVTMSSKDYHAHPAVGHSGLVRLMRSPAHFRSYLETPPSPTSAMQIGSAFHAFLLEPEKFEQEFAVAPKFDRRTKDGKAASEAWEAENAGKTALSADQMAAIEQMAASVRAHAGAAMMLGRGLAEMSGFWIDQETGIECKVRPDWLVTMEVSGSYDLVTSIVDVKTCTDASLDGFSRSIANLGYDLQAAFYQDGVKALTGRKVPFYFLAVEKDPPYAVAVYQASEEMIEVGRSKYRAALELLKWCRDNDRWPAYQPNGEIETINLPRWATNFNLEG